MNSTFKTLSLLSLCLLLTSPTFSQTHHNEQPVIDAERFYQYAVDFHKGGNLERAIDYYTEAILKDPYHTNALYNRGLAYYTQEKYNKALYDFDQVIDISPDDVQAFEQRARVKFLLNDPEGAYLDYSYALEQSPSSILFVNRGMASSMLENYSKALKDYDDALEKNPSDAEAYVNKGDIFFATGDYKEAIQLYTLAIQLVPGDERTYNNRANAYIKLALFDQALQDYNTALQIKENSYTHVNRGFYWMDRLQPETALNDFLIASKMDYRNAGAFYGVGMVKLESGELLSALDNFNKAIDLDSKNELYFNLRGVTYHELSFYEDAIYDFDLALKNNPNYTDALRNRSLSYYLTGNIADAFADLEKALAINPGDTIAQNRLELLQQQSNQSITQTNAPSIGIQSYAANDVNDNFSDGLFEEEDYESVVDPNLNSSNPNPDVFIPKGIPERKVQSQPIVEAKEETYLLLSIDQENTSASTNKMQKLLIQAMSHLEAKQYKAAIKYFDTFIKQNPKHSQALNGRGVAFYKMDLLKKATTDFSKAIELNPSFSEAYYNRGNLFFDQKQINKATADFSKVIQLSGDFSNAFFMRGLCYSKQNNISKAIGDFNYALTLDPQNVKALNNRGTLLFITGNIFEALKDYNQAIEYSPLEAIVQRHTKKSIN